MQIGHINLEPSMNGAGEHFIRLVEALCRQDFAQHVLVANASLAKRVAVYDGVTTGPVVRTPIMASCLMTDVSVVHAHDVAAGRAGLLMTLTRSVPYVLTSRSTERAARNPISRSVLRRAASIICPSQEAIGALAGTELVMPPELVDDMAHESVEGNGRDNRIAAEHVRIYRRAVGSWRIPAMLL